MLNILIATLPELIKIAWAIYKRHKAGHDSKLIKRSLTQLREIFELSDRVEAANRLNDLFNNRPKS